MVTAQSHFYVLFILLFVSIVLGEDSIDAIEEFENATVPDNGTASAPPSIFAHTLTGTLGGESFRSRHGRHFYSFRGIPYAQAPIGRLRFEPPLPAKKWRGVRDARRFGSPCMQVNVLTFKSTSGNEDCLFLNVFTHHIYEPHKLARKPNLPLHPVIVFIHGGVFMFGQSNTYRPKYFMDENVVLVTINYRLASFGFLNTGDSIVPGNMGLKDQTMALEWIKSNIVFFGGDPSRVTIMGESAGSISTHLHTISPLSKGLFHRSISQSGTALSSWAITPSPAAQARDFARQLRCPSRNTRSMINCLKSLDAETIAKAHTGYINGLAVDKPSLFGPTIENTTYRPFLDTEPRVLLKSGKINNVTWMNGVNSEDGLVYLIPVIRNKTIGNLLNRNWSRHAPAFLQLPKNTSQSFINDIWNYYMGYNSPGINLRTLNQAANMVSDRAFFTDSHDVSLYHAKAGLDVYPYFYKYPGRYAMAKLLFVKAKFPFPLPSRYDFNFGTFQSWFKDYVLGIKEPPSRYGVGHSDELVLFFNSPFVRREITRDDEDYAFSRILIKLWTSFAETGIPDTKALRLPQWTAIKKKSEQKDFPIVRYFLQTIPEMREEPFYKRIQFWKRPFLE